MPNVVPLLTICSLNDRLNEIRPSDDDKHRLECWPLSAATFRVSPRSRTISTINRHRPRKAKKKIGFILCFLIQRLTIRPEVLDFCHVVRRSHWFIEAPEKKRKKTTRKSTAIVKPPVYGALSNLHSSCITKRFYVRRTADGPHQKLVFVYLSLYTRHITAWTSKVKKQESMLNFFSLSCCCRCPAIKSLPIVGITFVFVCLSSGLDTKSG